MDNIDKKNSSLITGKCQISIEASGKQSISFLPRCLCPY